MTPEDIVLCLCTRQNFEAEHQRNLIDVCQNQTIHWDIVFETAKKHQVTPIIYTNLARVPDKSLGLPSTIQDRFKKAQIRNIFIKRRTEAMLEKVLAFFNQKGIDVMLIKGEALGYLVYDQPWYTVSHDIDLVFRVRGSELTETGRWEILELLEGFNYESIPFKEHIEYDFFEHHDITMNNLLPVDWGRIWVDAKKIHVRGYEVFVMTPEDTLLAAAINSCRKRFFRLKSLCDMAAIIEKYPMLDWHMVISRAHEYKCNTILYTALVVTRAILGCNFPDHVLSGLKVSLLRGTLIKYLVKNLSQSVPLLNLYVDSGNATFNRTLSWPLFLTYATYRFDLLLPKLGELYRAWRNPLPSAPG